MSPHHRLDGTDHQGFPRVSGDEPRGLSEQTATQVFSPRERG